MEILVIGENIEKQTRWISLLEDTSSFRVTSRVELAASVQKFPIYHNLLICLNNRLDKYENMLVDNSIATNVPVIYVIDEISKEDYAFLLDRGIKGVINSDMSLESIKESIKIVAEGGIYINPPNKDIDKKIRTQSNKLRLDIVEWQVFSLTHKGYGASEISDMLKMDEDKIRSYLALIDEKTKSNPASYLRKNNNSFLN